MAPVLTSLNPSFGPPAGGNTVQIFGSGFTEGVPSTVRFGTTATTFTIVSDTHIDASAPPGAGTVEVTVAAVPSGTSNPLPYTYGGAGLLFFTDGIDTGNVYSVPQTGGTPTLLAFGLSIPEGLVRVGTLLYFCEFFANRVSTVPVTGGTATPLVTGLSLPTDITVSGNTLFIADPGHSDRVVSAPITGTDTPTMVATSPTGIFWITDGAPTQPGMTPVAAGLPTAPVLTSLTPSSGPTAGANTVEIFGSGFTGVGPLIVRFGSTATTFTIVSDTRIDAIAPPGTGTVDVTVAALLNGTSNPLSYTYGGLLFFTDTNFIGTVFSVPRNGGTPTLVATDLSTPVGLVRVGELLYICEQGTARVSTVPVTGGTATPLVTGLSLPTDITVSGSTLFITDQGTDQIVSAPITGTATPTVLATSPTGVFAITT
ncbi:IPT/TIG domain-containing protein [Nocardia sp. CNY236]|uniref:IPT/TIG domain-containing protein n=1 Tax=Nocardia sp. CNY236 TaxID=1169152 RepID=UPI0004100976|nr:IPT/TIG domain-containing protein [Nocardia sp. CNY236]